MILLSRLFDDYTQGSYAMALILRQCVALTVQGVKIDHMPLEVLLTILISCVFAVVRAFAHGHVFCSVCVRV